MGDDLAERFRRARRDPALAVLEGFHAVKHALRFGGELLEVVTEDLAALLELAELLAADVRPWLAANVVEHPRGTLALLTPEPPDDVIALARRPPVALPSPGAAPLLLLERPTHLGNVGAAIRVAAAAGAAGVVTTGPIDPWHPQVIRGARGLHFALPVLRLPEAPAGWRLLALHPEGEPLRHGVLGGDACLAFGSERHGLSAALLARAERRLTIPMRPGVSSLNLATAVAVSLYVGWAGAGLRMASGAHPR
jgi:tRNA G18 (ribose-2'-O)-methylase SpoU